MTGRYRETATAALLWVPTVVSGSIRQLAAWCSRYEQLDHLPGQLRQKILDRTPGQRLGTPATLPLLPRLG